jgi:hypothetical protein
MRRELFQRFHLAPEAQRFDRPARDQHQPIGVKRLLDEIVSAAANGGDRRLDSAVPGNHHDRHVGVFALDHIKQREAVEPAAFKPDVEQDEVRPPRLNRADRIVRILRRADRIAFILQNTRHQFADIRFVVDNKNIGCHTLNSGCFLARE